MKKENAHKRQYFPTSAMCFVCGEQNQAGLQARFYVEDALVKADLNPKPHHCGYRNIVHGGVTASVLDECMSWAAARAVNRLCYTAELTLRYLRPVKGDRPATAQAEVVRAGKRIVQVTGAIMDEAGEVCVRGAARFVPLSVAETLAVDDYLIYRGGDVRPFEALEQKTADG